MNHTNFFKFIVLWLIIISPVLSMAQSATVDSIAIADTAYNSLQAEAASTKTNLTLALISSNNVSYYGQVAEKKLPYVALNATVRFKPGIYVSGLAYKLFGDSNIVSATSLTAGYELKLLKKLRADISYSHAFYASNSPFLQASTPNFINATFSYDHYFTSALNFDYAFGNQNDFFITITNYKSFDFNSSGNKAIVSLTPQADIILGTQRFYSSYLIRQEERGYKGEQVPITPVPASVTTVENKFGIISYNFRLPVSYNRSSYLVELAYQLSLLGKNAASGAGTAHSFFTLSAYYQLNFKK